MNALKTAWQVLWCIPAALAWMVMYGIIWIGFGPVEADSFIYHWNMMVHRHDAPPKPDESGGVQQEKVMEIG